MSYKIICLLAVVYLMATASCADHSLTEEQLIERLNSQMKAGEYERIYEQASASAMTRKYSKAEFTERLSKIVDKIKETDDTLTFIKPAKPRENLGFSGADGFAYRYVEKDGEKFGIDFWFDSDSGRLRLSDICIDSDDNSNFRFCASDTSKI